MKIICADCEKENCNKPGGWHLIHWLKYTTPKTLENGDKETTGLYKAAIDDPEMLRGLCEELGWQGGTIHQVRDEILKRF
mgnify:CR=1 FL=1